MKKFLILFTAVCIIFALSACSSKEYVDVVVTSPVTDENGETVTDASGKNITEIVTDKSGSAVTSSVEKNSTKAQDITVKTSGSSGNATSKKSNIDKSNKVSKGSDTSAGNSKNDKTQKEKTTKKATTGKENGNTGKTNVEEKPTETTTKSKRRNIKLNVRIPYYTDKESVITVSYRVVGDKKYKSFDEENIIFDGKTVKTYTIEKIKGDVEIIVKMAGADLTANTAVVPASDVDQEITISPVTGIEVMNGIDD